MALDDSYTKSLLHFEGADASTTITDESGMTWTRVGTGQIDTAAYKFGTSSLLLDGNSDSVYATLAAGSQAEADWNLGSVNFTIDFWMKSTQTTQYATLVSKNLTLWGIGRWSILCHFVNAGDINFYAYDYSAAAGLLVTAGGLVNSGNWTHIAVVRSGNDWALYVDGVSRATRTTATTIQTVAGNVYIGQDESYFRWYNGWIDEFRFSRGVARWTAAFTPPAIPYNPRQCYLHNRRDRMDGKPISTHNRLA